MGAKQMSLLILLVAAIFVGNMSTFIVNQREQALVLQFGKPQRVVQQPGLHFRLPWQSVTFFDKRLLLQDAPPNEIITKDKQRIGLVVSGDIFRPSLAHKDVIRDLWAQYRGIYLDDELARMRVQDLARQAMKVCVGDRTFDDNIIGTARDELRACTDAELSELARNFGLEIENIFTPVLHPVHILYFVLSLDKLFQALYQDRKHG